MFDRMLLKAIHLARTQDITEWNRILIEKSLSIDINPKATAIIESLRNYIELKWAGEEQSRKAWNKVLTDINEYDLEFDNVKVG